MLNENTKISGCDEVAMGVEKRIKTAGIKGLNIEEAKRLGVIDRITHCLCAAHSCITVAYRMVGDVDYILSELGGRKNEIAMELNKLDKAAERFFRFWSDYYMNDEAKQEMMKETDHLYKKIMKWLQLPEEWQIGDPQRTPAPADVAISVRREGDSALYFKRSSVDVDTTILGESWSVSKYNEDSHQHIIVSTDMDKSSAVMSAKRLSANDGEDYYIASLVTDIEEKRTDVHPYKVYKEGEEVGTVTI